MKKKNLILIIILLLYLGKSIAQNPPYFTDYLDCNSCLTIDNTNYFLINGCANQSNYYNSNNFFMINPSSAVKTIRLNFIFVQKNDGTGNFIQNSIEHNTVIDDIVNTMNVKMANLAVTQCGGGINIHSKIQ